MAFCNTGVSPWYGVLYDPLTNRTLAKERSAKRHVIVNPREPRAGQFAFRLYEQTHPVRGNDKVLDRFRKEFAGLRGHRVTLHFHGLHADPDTGKGKKFHVQRTVTYRTYKDIFGPGSAYASVLHYIKGKWSEEELVTTELSLEIADDDAEDNEDES